MQLFSIVTGIIIIAAIVLAYYYFVVWPRSNIQAGHDGIKYMSSYNGGSAAFPLSAEGTLMAQKVKLIIPLGYTYEDFYKLMRIGLGELAGLILDSDTARSGNSASSAVLATEFYRYAYALYAYMLAYHVAISIDGQFNSELEKLGAANRKLVEKVATAFESMQWNEASVQSVIHMYVEPSSFQSCGEGNCSCYVGMDDGNGIGDINTRLFPIHIRDASQRYLDYGSEVLHPTQLAISTPNRSTLSAMKSITNVSHYNGNHIPDANAGHYLNSPTYVNMRTSPVVPYASFQSYDRPTQRRAIVLETV